MRRQTPIAHLLYNQLYPNPQPSDPPSFSAHLARNLVPEVRIEVATYYGDLSSTESRYPGLNYCYGPHRMRLGRFKHHRRLFHAFDRLGLTDQEIQEFCCWEGTRWARERYERDEGVKVVDTTGDEIAQFVDRRIRRKEQDERRGSITRKTSISIVVEETTPGAAANGASSSSVQREHLQPDAPFTYTGDAQPASPPSEDDYMSDESSSATALPPPSEPAHETVARLAHIRDLERQRAQAISARLLAAWESGEQLDPELEQYLKEQSEQRGNLRGLDLTSFMARRRHGGTEAVVRATRAAA